MVVFEDVEEGGRMFLNVALNPQAMADGVKQSFAVYPSMLRPNVGSNPDSMKKMLAVELTSHLNTVTQSGPAYLLRGLLKEKKSADTRLPMLGRRICKGIVRWGSSNLKIHGDFSYIPLYWEWTEDVLARCSGRLKSANIYNAVYASLYQYDREPRIMRAFCESWCPSTNTLHTRVGEWSLLLWDLHEIGGLPIAGRRYDETVPSFKCMNANDMTNSGTSACEYLFRAYCHLASLPESKNVVRVTQWIRYWCKCKSVYSKAVREATRRSDIRPKSTRDPKGEILDKPLEWTPEEITMFKQLGLFDPSKRKTVYLGAHLSTWLCVFALPEGEDQVIRPETFEVAACMAEGTTFGLATAVLASIYHGLNKMVNADRPACSGSVFSSHYLYGWLAYYFDTHHVFDDVPSSPLMLRYSGSRGAKLFGDAEARNLIHDGSSFKASSLVLRGNRCAPVCDENLDAWELGYMISLRTAYLPLRSKASFFLEPYHPTRFCRQFGFYQDVPGIISRDPDDGYVTYNIALRNLRLLLFKDSGATMMFPGRFLNRQEMTTPNFKQWWAKVNVSDLQENIDTLVSSVDSRVKNKTPIVDTLTKKAHGLDAPKPASLDKLQTLHRPEKRSKNDVEEEDDVNYKHRRVRADDDFNSGGQEVQKALSESIVAVVEERHVRGRERTPTPVMQESPPAADVLSSCGRSKSGKAASVETIDTQPQSTQITEMHGQLTEVLLKSLLAAAPAQVEKVAAHVTIFFGNIRDSGGDVSILQAAVDAYVKSAAKLLALEQDVAINAERYTNEIAEVGANLRSAQIAYKGAVQTSQSLEKQEGVVAIAIVDAEMKLQTLRDEAKNIQDLRIQQTEVVSGAKSKVDELQQKLVDLKTPQASSGDLSQAQRDFEECKRAIKAVIP